ncbi:MAG: hypothetical protein ACR2OC_13130 [Solirubrobacterales bacterium]
MNAERPRGITSVVLVVLGGLALVAGIVAFYARSEIVDQDAFADHALERALAKAEAIG